MLRAGALVTALLVSALLHVGCNHVPSGPARATAEPGIATSVAASGTVAAATPIATPSVSPTAAIAGEPIASTAALLRSLLPPVAFLRGGETLAELPIEVPPPAQYEIGLSGRRSLGDERGMLFYYTHMNRQSFWMKDTHFDLSIAFVASDERIVDIEEMQAESTTIITPRADYQYAIEAPAGWYLQHKIGLGERAHLAFPLPQYLTSE